MDLRVIPVVAVLLGGVVLAVRLAAWLLRWAKRHRVALAEGLLVETARDALGRWCDALNDDPHAHHGHGGHDHCHEGSHGHGGWSDVPDCGGMDGGGAPE